MVGVEEVVGVVALLHLTKPDEDIWREDLGYIEGLLNEVEVAAGVVGVEGSLEGAEPRTVWRHGLRLRNEADPDGDEGAGQGGKRSRVLWCPRQSAAAMAQFDRGELCARARPIASTSESIAEAGRSWVSSDSVV